MRSLTPEPEKNGEVSMLLSQHEVNSSYGHSQVLSFLAGKCQCLQSGLCSYHPNKLHVKKETVGRKGVGNINS